MKNFGKMLGKSLVFCIVMLVLCSFVYPLALTGVSQLTMKVKANGSLINKYGELTTKSEEACGSALVGQEFKEDYYFKGRVSAIDYNTYREEEKVNGEYGGVSSGSYNYGNSNPKLQARIQEDLEEFLAANPDVKKEEIPSDLLTASGSGLDPHISVEAAKIQIAAVAKASGISQEEVENIVKKNTEKKIFGIFGENKVNVLKCNLAIQLMLP